MGLRDSLDHYGATKVRGLQSVLTFGTYAGDTVVEVIKDAPDYIEWCIDNVEGFELDEEATDALNQAVNSEGQEAHDDLEGIF